MGDLILSGLDGQPVTIDDSTLEAFQKKLRYPLLQRGQPGFDQASSIWNAMITSKPALVAQMANNADVIAALELARTHRIRVSVKGGGHNIAGLAIADGGLLLDMSRMRGVHVDRERKLARVQPGCQLGDVDRETEVHKLAAVLGFVSETGVAGLTLGGGFGYLSRRFGWTVDTLEEVDIVTPDGELRRASRKENADLFWAVRGGGGNFGVVTSFCYNLFDVGPTVTGGLQVWEADQASEVLPFLVEYCARAPRELTLAMTMRMVPGPDACVPSFLPKHFTGKLTIGVIVCHTGPLEQAQEDIAPLLRVGKPIGNSIRQRRYVSVQCMTDEMQPRGFHNYWKSEYCPKLTSELMSTAWEQAKELTSLDSQVALFLLGGAIGDRDPDDGAVGNRDAGLVVNAAGLWKAEDERASEHYAWVRRTWEAIRPFSTGGVYVNFQTAEEGEDRVKAAYGKNLERLAAIKRKYDPDNILRANRNIRPQP